MKNKIKIKEPVKAVLAVLIFGLILIWVSGLCTYPYRKMYSNKNQYDTLFLGASQTVYGIIPSVVDEKTGSNSYILGSGRSTLYARQALAESALQQDSLKTVVIDVAYDVLSTDTTSWDDKYEYPIIAKINGLFRKWGYGLRYLTFMDDQYDAAFKDIIKYGLTVWGEVFDGTAQEQFYSRKGYDPQRRIDTSLKDEDTMALLNSSSIDTDIKAENVEQLEQLIQTCQNQSVRVILMVTPLSERMVWLNDGFDVFFGYVREVADKYGCECYDFNLLKDRQQYFDDEHTFLDENHLCDAGAHIFSEMMAEYLVEGTANDFSDRFYDSYAEAKLHSVYYRD